MNERIELLRDAAVHVNVTDMASSSKVTLRVPTTGKIELTLTSDGRPWLDAAARDALIDALQCHKATGSFSALADTSAVPFVGKRMRCYRSGGHKPECVVLEKRHENWSVDCLEGPTGFFRAGPTALSPLVAPAPKVRPYKASEVAPLFLTEVTPELRDKATGERRFVKNINRYGVTLRAHEYSHEAFQDTFYEWSQLLHSHEWKDGSPCGVEATE